ncbi:MAG TPA: hypothetical protein PKA27_06310 [Fimbriimonadaceae bacterium]|nr:hypothetical protein [Fimbriimonadaceae bacterium]
MVQSALEVVRSRRASEMFRAASRADEATAYPYRPLPPDAPEWATVHGLYFKDQVVEAQEMLDAVGIGGRGEYAPLRRLIIAEAETAKRSKLVELEGNLVFEFIEEELPLPSSDLAKVVQHEFESICHLLGYDRSSPTLVTILHRGVDVGFNLGYETPKQGYDKVCLNAETLRDGSFVGVLRHELAHVAAYQLSESLVPTWVNEGIAIYLGGQLKPYHADWVTPRELEAEFRRTASPLRAELNAREDAYQQAGWLIWFLASEFGDSKLGPLLKACTEESLMGFFRRALALGSRMEEPIRKTFNISERELFESAKKAVFSLNG